MQFIAFDLETTGTVAGVDQIVEIAAVKFTELEPTAIFTTLINPQRLMPPSASAINGITDDMLVGKPTIESVLSEFADFCGDLTMVAHNASFDTQFLTASIKKFESPAPKGIILDTLALARKLLPGLPNYKLVTLVRYLNIPSSDFHRAEEDAIYCGKLFLGLLKKIGAETDIDSLVTLTGRPKSTFPQIARQPKQLNFGDWLNP